MRIRLCCLLLVMLLIGACASRQAVPEQQRLDLKLAPAALGASITLQQHLKVERQGRIDELDAALEVDPTHLELVGLALGQRVFSLDYDGVVLKSWRHPMLPEQVKAENVLDDMQLVLWPTDVIARALPAGWRIEDTGLHRTLYLDGVVVTQIDYSALPHWSGVATLESLRYHYRLTIQSVPAS